MGSGFSREARQGRALIRSRHSGKRSSSIANWVQTFRPWRPFARTCRTNLRSDAARPTRPCLRSVSLKPVTLLRVSVPREPSPPDRHPCGAAGDGDALGTVSDGEGVDDVIAVWVDPRD